MEKLQAKWAEGKFVCVGLDSDTARLPARLLKGGVYPVMAQEEFNLKIINVTHDLVCAYKPNLAFYRGTEGKRVLRGTIQRIRSIAPGVVIILDAKWADIGNTNYGYAEEVFDWYGADAVTVHPYLGREAMMPFLERADKGVIVLCRTSNPGAGEFQDLPVWKDEYWDSARTRPLYQLVAKNVADSWNAVSNNCAVVVGATYPEELGVVRGIVGDMPILIPGIGAQGGDLEATLKNGFDSRGQGVIVNSSRDIIFASDGEDYAEAARAETQKLHDAITSFRVAA